MNLLIGAKFTFVQYGREMSLSENHKRLVLGGLVWPCSLSSYDRAFSFSKFFLFWKKLMPLCFRWKLGPFCERTKLLDHDEFTIL